MSLLSIAIVTHKGGAHLDRCIQSIVPQDKFIRKLIVIVTSSKKIIDSDIEYVLTDIELNYSQAVNKAFDLLEGSILILNDDTELSKDALYFLLRNFQSNAILQPEIRYMDRPNLIENTGHYIRIDGSNKAHSRKCTNRVGSTLQRMCFSGAAFVIPEEIRNKVGYFDIELSPFGEDLDYSLRTIRMGFDVVVVPEAIVYHKLGASYGRYSKDKIIWVESHRIQAKYRSMPLVCLVLAPVSTTLRYLRSSIEDEMIPNDKQTEAGFGALIGCIKGYYNLSRSLQKRRSDSTIRNDFDFLLHWMKIRKA
jgi:GT2 family glycosyltransferase